MLTNFTAVLHVSLICSVQPASSWAHNSIMSVDYDTCLATMYMINDNG